MKLHTLALAAVCFLGSGCSTQVELGLKNVGQPALIVAVQLETPQGVKTGELSFGELVHGATRQSSFKVRNGAAFTVTGTTSRGAEVYSSGKISVTGTQDPFRYQANIEPRGRMLDDAMSFEAISRSFKHLGTDIGAQPIGLKDALDTRLGALVVARPGDGGGAEAGEILYAVNPNVFGVYVMQLEDVRYPPTDEDQEVEISGTKSLEASAEYGPIAHFGFNWDSGSVYKMSWVLRGYGQINKVEDPEKDPILCFNQLPAEHMQQITAALKDNPTARIYYINRAYVLDRAEMSITEGTEVKGKVDVDVVIKGSTVYSFKDKKESKKGYGPVVLNYWGDELHVVTMPKSDFAKLDATPRLTNPTRLKELHERLMRTPGDTVHLLLPGRRSVAFKALDR